MAESHPNWIPANRLKHIHKALETRADKLAARATAISRAEGGTANYRVVKMFRPGGRVAFDVVSDNPDEEYGTDEVRRIGALRRALRGE